MRGRFKWHELLWIGGWLVILVGALAVTFAPAAPLNADATKRESLKVHSSPTSYRPMERAVDFGLEKMTTLVNYLLVVAAGLVAYLTKSVMELRAAHAEAGPNREGGRLGRLHFLLLLHAGIACLFSMLFGLLAYLSVPDIAVTESFDVTAQVGRFVGVQAVGVLAAVLMLLVAFGGVVRKLLP